MITLREFVARVERRADEPGLAETSAITAALRDRGAVRTAENRELLRHAEAGAVAAGRRPIVSHY